jgi:hypothetical protein
VRHASLMQGETKVPHSARAKDAGGKRGKVTCEALGHCRQLHTCNWRMLGSEKYLKDIAGAETADGEMKWTMVESSRLQ